MAGGPKVHEMRHQYYLNQFTEFILCDIEKQAITDSA